MLQIVCEEEGGIIGHRANLKFFILIMYSFNICYTSDFNGKNFCDKQEEHSFNTSSFEKSTQNLQNSLVSIQDRMYKNKFTRIPYS